MPNARVGAIPSPSTEGWMDGWMESSPVEKDFEVLVNEKLDMSQPHALTTQKSIHVLGCIGSVTSRLTGHSIPLLHL